MALITRRISILLLVLVGVLLVVGAGYKFRGAVLWYGGLLVNYARSWNAPPGTLAIEVSSDHGLNSSTSETGNFGSIGSSDEWTSYNGSLTSERYSSLRQIDQHNVAALRVLCTYDTKQFSAFQAGPLVIGGSLIGTTPSDIFSIDPATCAEHWRRSEPAAQIAVNRGAAYLDGRLYRGAGAQVICYDLQSGATVWQTTVADPSRGESIPAAPIAWNGLIFIGNAGGDRKGVKGRMYALDAKTGRIVWEFYLVPKGPDDLTRGPQGSSSLDSSTWQNEPDTPISGGASWTSYTLDPSNGELYVPAGNAAPDFAPDLRKGKNLYSGSVVVLDAMSGAYKRHYELTTGDWHDWDVSNTPAILHTKGGQKLMAIAPKDGRLYGINLDSGASVYQTAVNRVENPDVRFSLETSVHFCPGARGGGEWNGAAYEPGSNLLFVGEMDWCSTVRLRRAAEIVAVKGGQVWAGMASRNPYDTFGKMDDYRHWGGWVYASDADSGAWAWRAHSNYPIQSGLTVTAGGLLFFGDMGGNFYALNSASGKRLWGTNLRGAIGGGVITYTAGGVQRIAVAAGFTSILWPTKVVTGKIVILGLGAT